MPTPAKRVARAGATIVEAAIVLSVFLMLVLGMLELTLALVRHTVMSDAARRVARAAVVRGSMASAANQWGPSNVSTTAGSNHPAAAPLKDLLMTIDPNDVTIQLRWLDGGNKPDQRVQVVVSYTHLPLVPTFGWYSSLPLTSQSTMRIAH